MRSVSSLSLVVCLLAACPAAPPPIDVGEGEGEEGEGEEGEGEEGEGEEGEGEGEAVVDHLLVSVADTFCAGFCQVEIGASVQLAVQGFDVDNNEVVVDAADVVWSVDDEGVGTVSAAGVVTGVSVGFLGVTAALGDKTGQAFLDVVGLRPLRVEASPARLDLDLEAGDTAALTTAVFAAGDVLLDGAPVVFIAGDAGVATVDGAGVVTAVGAGATVVYVEAGFAVFDSVEVHVTSTVPPPPALSFAQISAGSHHTCGVTVDGDGVCFGDNQFGQLGNGVITAPGTVTATPGAVAGQRQWRALSAGQFFSCGLDDGGRAWCWGLNGNGELGGDTGDVGGSPVPVAVTVDGDRRFASIAAGGTHACAIDVDGALFCWGANFSGQVGDGSSDDRFAPVAVGDDVGAGTFAQVVAGLFSTCALDDAGAVFCWGDRSQGQIGDGGDVVGAQLTPVRIAGDDDYARLALTGSHVCAVTTDGALACWGDNTFGQVGTGSAGPPENAPQKRVDDDRVFVDVAVGAHHSCVVDDAGAVACFGNNDFATLGDGTLTSRLSPTPLGGDAASVAFVALDGGPNHTCGRADDDAVWCFGSGETGELGGGRAVSFGAFATRVVAP